MLHDYVWEQTVSFASSTWHGYVNFLSAWLSQNLTESANIITSHIEFNITKIVLDEKYMFTFMENLYILEAIVWEK